MNQRQYSALGFDRRHTFAAAPLVLAVAGLYCWAPTCMAADAAAPVGAATYHSDIEPVLEKYCYGCHGLLNARANVVFDNFETDRQLLDSRELWSKALRQLRAGFMPPRDKPRPTPQEVQLIATWIKSSVFQIDPRDPDPGRVTVRRLNRHEYRNTVRDLMGVTYDVDSEFPADDTGYGFDTIGDVLTLSPLLLEKYVAAARAIVAQAVPVVGRVPPETTIEGRRFHRQGAGDSRDGGRNDLYLPYYEPATVSAEYTSGPSGRYLLDVHVSAHEKFVEGVFDYNKCRLKFKVDGRELLNQEFSRQEGKSFHFESEATWEPGKHELMFELEPTTPDEKQTRALSLRIVSVAIRGPMSPEHWVRPAGYERFFPRDLPAAPGDRREYARELLARFAARAFRRPPEPETITRLVDLAEAASSRAGATFEAGIAQAMTAVLASPRFLFREEFAEPNPAGGHPLVDEFALASRLSYFLWSTLPDDELFQLAGSHQLRANFAAQTQRLLADPRSREWIRHFTGQWLQARDIESANINAFAVISRDEKQDPDMERRRVRFRELRSKAFESLTPEEKAEVDEARASFAAGRRRFQQYELNGEMRRAMRDETEMLFAHIVRDDRSLLELIDSDYTFLNERLARHYGIAGVKGGEMRRVPLPPDSPRGGVLTQATVLVVTSNPDRTSPVKRGLFILENLLGTPPAPPPPNVPPLEEAARQAAGRQLTLREQLELHRSQSLCNSCHNRMDPLGLAFENFNALGMFRENRPDRNIDASGQLLTGEKFTNVRELKRILATDRRRDFYRCLTEKLLIFAVGRGLEDFDVETVDRIVDRLDQQQGKASVLISGILDSPPFQKRRAEPPDPAAAQPGCR